MKLLYCLLVIGVIALLAVPSVEANPCRQQIVVQKVVQAEVVYPVVQQVVVPVYGLIPLYQPAAYTAPPAAATTEHDVLKELIAAVRELRADVQALKLNKQEAAPKDDRPAVVAMRKNCASCHNAASADADGGGLTLFAPDGSFVGVKEDMARRIVRRVGSGAMPPPPAKLEEDAKKAILDAFRK